MKSMLKSKMMYPNLKEERKFWKKGIKIVAGLDEAGRGALSGPVVAAAVSIITNFKFKIDDFKNIKDSKKLTPQKRKEFFKLITKNPNIKWGIGKVSERVIDRINIKNAVELAMEKALKNLERKIKREVDFLIIDGNQLNSKKLKNKKFKLIVKGDEKVLSCAMASIISKVIRDKIMESYAKKFPQYGFEKHKGYGTKLHFEMLKKYGPCKIHRKSFLPIAKI
jgi:ribonuclease HII